jgi:hypothetical protein
MRLAGIVAITGLGMGIVQAQASKEYQIKAAFLFNFAQFVEWPASAFPEAGTPLCIGVLGEDPFGNILNEIVKGEKVDGHSLVIRRYSQVSEINACHILFVGNSEKSRMEEIVAGLNGQTILTVGEAEGFTAKGGMIRFVVENNKIRLKINLDAARKAGLQISSKLLRPADIVGSGRD